MVHTFGNPVGVRIPADLREQIDEAAKEDSRTFSDEVRALIMRGLERRSREKLALEHGLRSLAAREAGE